MKTILNRPRLAGAIARLAVYGRASATTAILGALALSASVAQATVVTGNFNNAGYSMYNFSLASTETMTFKLVPSGPGGVFDPMLSLFDGAGNFMLAVDDEMNAGLVLINFSPTMTQTLGPGNYTMLIGSSSEGIATAIGLGASAVPGFTDGVNFGTFFAGGNGTLADHLYYLDNALIPPPVGTWAMDVSTGEVRNNVPEPGSLALMGLAFAGLVARRRQARG